MDRFILFGILAATVGVLGAASLPAASTEQEVPERAPGYWEITTVAPVSGMTKTKVCVGEDDNVVTPESGDCSAPTITPLNEGIIVDVVCASKEGKQTISTAFTGDFKTRYHATLKTTFDPPLGGGLDHMGVIIDGKYLGPDCPAGEAPSAAQ